MVLLGYRDSGMPGSPANANPASFAMAPLEEAVGRLVAVMRRERPQVVVTYPDEQSEYPHPDHLRVHEISVAAFEASGDPQRFVGTGKPFTPLKLYYSTWPRQQMIGAHEKFVELGLESPFSEEWLERLSSSPASPAPRTSISPGSTCVARRCVPTPPRSIRTHGCGSGFPPEVQASIHPFDDYILARSRVGPLDAEEDDLFAGVPI